MYGGGQRHRSEDGTTWESTALEPPGVPIGNFAVSSEGTFAAVNDGWTRWYEQQRFYRSTAGVTWEELPTGAFTGGHPIYFMSFGHVTPTPGCGMSQKC